MSNAQTTLIYATLGDFLGKLHATTFQEFGDVHTTTDEPGSDSIYELTVCGFGKRKRPYASWAVSHSDIVHEQLALFKRTGCEDLTGPVHAYFDNYRDAINFEVVPRLLHMDLHRGNIMIRHAKVSGILDIEESIVGHNEYDLMRTEMASFRGQDPALERLFRQGYSRHICLDEGPARAFTARLVRLSGYGAWSSTVNAAREVTPISLTRLLVLTFSR